MFVAFCHQSMEPPDARFIQTTTAKKQKDGGLGSELMESAVCVDAMQYPERRGARSTIHQWEFFDARIAESEDITE